MSGVSFKVSSSVSCFFVLFCFVLFFFFFCQNIYKSSSPYSFRCPLLIHICLGQVFGWLNRRKLNDSLFCGSLWCPSNLTKCNRTKCCKIMIWAFRSLLRAFFGVPTSWLGRQALASIQLFRSLISLNLLQTLFECNLLLELSLCMTSFAFLFTESSCSTFDELTNTNLYCWGAGKH